MGKTPQLVLIRSNVRGQWIRYILLMATLSVAGIVLYPWDMQLTSLLREIAELPGDFRRVLALCELVAHGTGVAIILMVIWCLAPHHRLHLPRVAACGFVAGLVATGIKLMHARLRPMACPPELEQISRTWQGWWPAFNENLPGSYDYAYQSFPSAHTATAVGFAIGMTWLFPRGKFVFISLAVLSGLQRVVFFAHWPSDVIFGAVVGVFFGACFVLPGTVGNYLFNRLEWRFGIGNDLEGLAVPVQSQIENHRRAA